MIHSGFIVAIDLGTSKITGVAGRRNENNVISILACESVPSDSCIRRGVVHNVDKVGAKVHKVVTLLQNKLDKKIDKVYVSLAGQSLHTLSFWVTKQLSGDTVTDEIIKLMHQEAQKFVPNSRQHYGVADVEYFVDDKPEKNPVGVPCNLIEAEYKIVVGRSTLMSNIEKGIKEKAGLKIADYTIGALASAAVALNDDEKEKGCAFVDFGAGTTTLSIYKGGILRRMVLIPFGGRSITRDICALNYTEDEAESSKIRLGSAIESKNKDRSRNIGGINIVSPLGQKSSSQSENSAELNNVIKMRLDEITANIDVQIKQSGYEGQLGSGLVITGGASQLRNLDLYLTEKLKMPVRKASAKKTLIGNAPELVNDPSLTQALGMLLLGNEDCAQTFAEKPREPVEEEPKPKKPPRIKPEKKPKDPNKPGIWDKTIGVFGGLFKEEEEEDENN